MHVAQFYMQLAFFLVVICTHPFGGFNVLINFYECRRLKLYISNQLNSHFKEIGVYSNLKDKEKLEAGTRLEKNYNEIVYFSHF